MELLSDLVRHPAAPYMLLTLWLLPAALQDYRTRRVSNWLTVPLFLLGWPAALFTGNVVFVLATFLGVYIAYLARSMGPADGKIAVGLAGLTPLVVPASALIQALLFLVIRLRTGRPGRLPGAIGFYLGAATATLALSWCAGQCGFSMIRHLCV